MNKNDRNTSSKVLAMYQAVVGLLEEGVDITTLKVADITRKAGIGKGTAYEYFSSKEEIITKALHWNLQQELENMRDNLQQVSTMKEQVFMGLQWIEQSVHRRSVAIQFMRTSGKIENMQEHCEQLHELGVPKAVQELCDLVLQKGEEEGIVSASLPDFMKYYVLICNCIGFFFMMNQMQNLPGMKPADIKTYIYETMVKSLQ